jgi:hypothetical protein
VVDQLHQARCGRLDRHLRQHECAIADVDHEQEHRHLGVRVGPLTQQQLPQHDAKGVHVAALCVGLPTQHLGRAVLDGALQPGAADLQLREQECRVVGTTHRQTQSKGGSA